MLKSINRYIYGPTPEERIKEWDRKLKTEQRMLDREIKQVRPPDRRAGFRLGLPKDERTSWWYVMVWYLQLDTATMKAKQSLKQLAKKGDVKSARLLAREVVRTNKQKNRLHMSKARLGSIQMQMQHQLCKLSPQFAFCMKRTDPYTSYWPFLYIAMVKVTGAFEKSTEIMKVSNQLIKLPQLNATMREMQMEMMKVRLSSVLRLLHLVLITEPLR
jgi:charged multivesicular body protein 3